MGIFLGKNLWGQVGIFDTLSGDFQLEPTGSTDFLFRLGSVAAVDFLQYSIVIIFLLQKFIQRARSNLKKCAKWFRVKVCEVERDSFRIGDRRCVILFNFILQYKQLWNHHELLFLKNSWNHNNLSKFKTTFLLFANKFFSRQITTIYQNGSLFDPWIDTAFQYPHHPCHRIGDLQNDQEDSRRRLLDFTDCYLVHTEHLGASNIFSCCI